MDRARRAGSTALIVVVVVALLAVRGGPASGPRSRLAAVHAGGLGGPDRRSIGIRRIRRDR